MDVYHSVGPFVAISVAAAPTAVLEAWTYVWTPQETKPPHAGWWLGISLASILFNVGAAVSALWWAMQENYIWCLAAAIVCRGGAGVSRVPRVCNVFLLLSALLTWAGCIVATVMFVIQLTERGFFPAPYVPAAAPGLSLLIASSVLGTYECAKRWKSPEKLIDERTPLTNQS